jgi:uncharacterized protein YjbI with pentapeptide repeats
MFLIPVSRVRFVLVTVLVSGLLAFVGARISEAEEGGKPKPINLALFDPIQIVSRDQSVKGFRFSLLYGRNANMQGLDLGLVAMTDQDFKGVQLALVGLTNGNFKGLQWDTVGWVEGSFEGVQLGILNGAKDMKWVQSGGAGVEGMDEVNGPILRPLLLRPLTTPTTK